MDIDYVENNIDWYKVNEKLNFKLFKRNEVFI